MSFLGGQQAECVRILKYVIALNFDHKILTPDPDSGVLQLILFPMENIYSGVLQLDILLKENSHPGVLQLGVLLNENSNPGVLKIQVVSGVHMFQ